MDPRRKFGNRGEDLAAVFFISNGFRIVQRNWKCRGGEIDLICERGGTVHFVEVKTRKNLMYGRPEEAITPAKLRHLRRAVEMYLAYSRRPPSNYQIDALAILLESGKPPEYNYIENIF